MREKPFGVRLYVGNLSRDVTDQDLAELFGSAGPVVEVQIVMHRETGRSRGFAFVEMQNDADGERAIERFDGHELKGRPIVVNEARARS